MRSRQNAERSVPDAAFTLIEVVICVGLVAFCLMALLGLIANGIEASGDSAQTVRAANLMTRLVAMRIASPTSGTTGGPIPRLDQQADSLAGLPTYLSLAGANVPKSQAEFQLNYRIVPSSGTETNTVLGSLVRGWAVLSWPAGASLTNASGTYEVNFLQPKP